MAKSRYKLVRIIRIFSILLLIILPLTSSLVSLSIYQKELKERREELTGDFFAQEKEKIQTEVDNISTLIEDKQTNSFSKTKKVLSERVNIAQRVARSIYNSNKNEISQEEIEKKIINAIAGITYQNKENIFFIIEFDGITLLNQAAPEEEGKKPVSFNNQEGDPIIDKSINSIKQSKSGFYTFYEKRENPGKRGSEKIAYLKEFKPYGWIIGSETNVEEINKTTQKEILDYLEESYDDDYFFVGTWEGLGIFGLGANKNNWDIEDINGKKVVQELIETAIKGGGFVEYQMPKGISERDNFKKISYTRGFKEWEWYFGTGIYTKELSDELAVVEQKLQIHALRHLMINLSISISMGLIILFFSIIFIRSLSKEFNTFGILFKAATLHSHTIDIDRFRFLEFCELAKDGNTLIGQKEKLEEDRQRLRSLETVGFLAGGIAHEFNNILAGIFGNIELANAKMKNGEPGKEFLETALDSMDTARELTGRLLTFSEGGNPRIEKIDCQNIKDTLTKKISDIEFPSEFNFKKDLPMVLADETQLNLIWESLINNIKEAMGEDKDVITITCEKKSLNNFSESHMSGDFICITISDKGPGISGKNLSKIFDPYFSTKEVGNGLGLSTVYTIIKRHKGHIDITSTVGKGTSVIIHLPSYTEK